MTAGPMGTSSISSSSYITQKNGNSYTTQSTVGITCDNMLLRITFSVAHNFFCSAACFCLPAQLFGAINGHHLDLQRVLEQ